MLTKAQLQAYESRKASEAAFDEGRELLAARCVRLTKAGHTLAAIAAQLNAEGLRTKTGKEWTYPNVAQLMLNPKPPKQRPSKKAEARAKRARKRNTVGKGRTADKTLAWVTAIRPDLEEWRRLANEYLNGKETGLGNTIQGVNAFIDFIIDANLPASPAQLLLRRTELPDMYTTLWGDKFTRGTVGMNNAAHGFIEWVLTQPSFCEEDDEGGLHTSPAFRNPISYLSSSGTPRPDESVRPTLPYGYVDELRQMIAEGPNFGEWKWAQAALGTRLSVLGMRKTKGAASKEDDDVTVAPVWFEVPKRLIDKSDPDCVWRSRMRTVDGPGKRGQGKEKELIYEMWSPVRWVALLVKLQLPLRTAQVRWLDSGEADTWRWEDGKWSPNLGALAKGSEARPHVNGVFMRPRNPLADGDAKVLLHINTNKTADRDKSGLAKGYTVPWVVGGQLHQDPFYWLEKLRNWQEKYNSLKRLTSWSELDMRHANVKSEAQLASYPDTAFLFRTPETFARTDRGDQPITNQALLPPWFRCLEELQSRLWTRGERLPNGQHIRLVVDEEHRQNPNAVLFSLHCLRVSLITALALDGSVPLAILQKIAGHSRLVMTLYYTKPGAKQIADAIQAGVEKLNESADETIVDWLANVEYDQLVQDVIANSIESVRVAVPEKKHLRSPAGWMAMVDGLCLVGGNNVEADAPGCHNGGENIGNSTSPRYRPVTGGARNCPMCRWFITRPYFLPQLATRWNNVMYHCHDAREQVVAAEQKLRAVEDLRAAALTADKLFENQRGYKDAQRTLENCVQRFDELTQTVAAVTRLIERCRKLLHSGGGDALVAIGGSVEFDYAIDTVDSELLQVSGVCEGALLYPDLDPGKAILRQGQLLDAALLRENLPPVFLTLSESEQQLVGSALLRELAERMNPRSPTLGRYEVISLIEMRQSLRSRLGGAVDEALRKAIASDGVPERAVKGKANRGELTFR